MVLYDLAANLELGLFLAYYRNFSIPSIAVTLQQNGEIIERPMNRSYDTAIVTYELISSGLNSDRGRHTFRLLNQAHHHVPGSQDDFVYVLLTLLVVPIRWACRHAWRTPTIAREMAAARFYQEIDARKNIAYSPAGAQLMASTAQVLKSRLPSSARSLTRPMLSAMFDDGRLTDALSLPRAARLGKTIRSATLTIRNATHRRPHAEQSLITFRAKHDQASTPTASASMTSDRKTSCHPQTSRTMSHRDVLLVAANTSKVRALACVGTLEATQKTPEAHRVVSTIIPANLSAS